MIYYLIDFLCLNIYNLNINVFLYKLQSIDFKEFICTLFLIYIISNNLLLLLMFILIFFMNRIVYKYLNDRIIIKLTLYAFDYLILFEEIKLSFFLNLILVIIIDFYKYNNTGDINVAKKTNIKFSS